MSLAVKIVTLAAEKGLKITTAESCTGGMISAALTDVAGSSAVFERGFVTYSNQAKIDMLGVSPATIQAHGAVSEQTAREMAIGAGANAQAQIAIAVSGIAGPGGSDHKPEGRVCFALFNNGNTTSETIELTPLGRDKVRRAARDHALMMILQALM